MKWVLVPIAVVLSVMTASGTEARILADGRSAICDIQPITGQVYTSFIQSLCSVGTSDVTHWIKLAKSSDRSDGDELRLQLQRRLGLESDVQFWSFVRMLATVGKLDILPDQMRDRLITIALRRLSVAGRIKNIPTAHANVQRLRHDAGVLLLREPSMVDHAESHLETALGFVCDSIDKADGPPCEPSAVEVFRDLAWLAESELEFVRAAKFHERAAAEQSLNTLGASYDLLNAGELWFDHAEATGQSLAFEKAVHSYRRILDLVAPADDRPLWARAQINLGVALARLSLVHLDSNPLRQSADALRSGLASLGVRDDDVNMEIPVARGNLGVTLYLIGEHFVDNEALEQSIVELQTALASVEQDHQPDLWASLQSNLSNSFLLLGQRTNDARMLRNARDASSNALSIWTRMHAPQDWAVTQISLGNVLREIGILANSRSTLDDAVAAYRSALTELTREDQPLDWALAQSNLGLTLGTIGSSTNRPDILEEAIKSFSIALDEMKKDAFPKEWGITQYALGQAQYDLAIENWSVPDMEVALGSLHAALDVRDRAFFPSARAQTLDLLSKAQIFVGVQQQDPLHLEQALAVLEEAREIRVIDLNMGDMEPRYADQVDDIGRAVQEIKAHLERE